MPPVLTTILCIVIAQVILAAIVLAGIEGWSRHLSRSNGE